jgi:hypothetical protein
MFISKIILLEARLHWYSSVQPVGVMVGVGPPMFFNVAPTGGLWIWFCGIPSYHSWNCGRRLARADVA